MSKKQRRKKKKSSVPPHIRMQKVIQQVTQQMADKGTAVEDGYKAFRNHFLPPELDNDAVELYRKIWFLSADFTYDLINGLMTDDREPTEDDLRRMTMIYNELVAFRKEVTTLHVISKTKQ
jgi:hypothetical protein